MSLNVVFSGGGTGGHLFPGLAVAAQLRQLEPDATITFAGSDRVWERRLVEEHGHRQIAMACRAWSRRPWRWPRFALDYAVGVRAAERWLKRHAADVVVGLGGWASVPMARAAIRRGIPLVLLEQNAMPGRATRWLAPHARRVCAAMSEAQYHLNIPADHFTHTGNPLRGEFVAPLVDASPDRRPRLLVLGGSRGSADLNRVVPEAIRSLDQRLAGWQVVHQTGHDGLTTTRQRYAAADRWVTLRPFFQNIAELLVSADLVICRGGGSTLSELAAVGVPAIVVPYPHAADDHQLHNARAYASCGACRIVDFRATSDPATALARELGELVGDADRRAALVAGMCAMARPNAAVDVARIVAAEAVASRCVQTR
jgi:UDP-N-acetylglucosamine--N-acetylmuramyl-(pentapeptide) pyrophosphoryl-undecaprenol N-acetylglucosamine transferase